MPKRALPTLLRIGLHSAESYAKVDALHRLGPAQLQELQKVGLEPPWAVMAAEPVEGATTKDKARFVAFYDEVTQGPFPYLDSTLADSHETYEVLGVTVALPFEDALELAERYDRDFLFWFDGEAFWYVPVPESTGAPVRLPAELSDWGPRLVQDQRVEGMEDPGGIDGEEEGPPELRLIT